MKAIALKLTALGTAVLLASCGGGNSPSDLRGRLVDAPAVLATLSVAQINAATASTGLQAITGAAKCDVKVVALNYYTLGVTGEQANASGVMLVPAGACTSTAALVAYAKGTDVQKPRTLASPTDSETFLLAAMYAAQGYAVVATDYLGFAKSTYSYHPYLHADSEASTVVDSIRAARNAATTVGASLSGKVMLTGYSQGGHSSMAAHRAIERDNATEINVVAGAHLAGPYNLSGSFKSTAVIAGYQFFVPLPDHLVAKSLWNCLQRRQHRVQVAVLGLCRNPAAESDAQLHHAGNFWQAPWYQRRNAGPGAGPYVPVGFHHRCANQ